MTGNIITLIVQHNIKKTRAVIRYKLPLLKEAKTFGTTKKLIVVFIYSITRYLIL